MPEEVRFFGRLSAFGLLITAIYWFVSYETAGTILLLGFGLGSAFATVVLFLGSRAVDWGRREPPWRWLGLPRGDDRAPFEDESGRLPGSSAAPFWVGLGLAFAALGLVFGPWLAAFGLLPLVLGGRGWLRGAIAEFDRMTSAAGPGAGDTRETSEHGGGVPQDGRRDGAASAEGQRHEARASEVAESWDHGRGGGAPRRILILGGGFAGVSTGQELVEVLSRQHRLIRPGEGRAYGPNPYEVMLLNRDNYFVFQPLLADIISGTIETTHVVVPLRRMLPGAEVEVGYVERIDTDGRFVEMRRRMNGQLVRIAYEALVIALGSVTDFSAVPGMAEHALGVRTLGDAFYLRNRALDMLEEARIEPDPERRRRLLTFVVVGGGSTGVEVAAELYDVLEVAAKSFSGIERPRVVLVHSGEYLVRSLGERLGRYTTRKLAQKGIELVLRRRIARVGPDFVELSDGSEIGTATVVSTVGNAPHPVVASLRGRHLGGWIAPDATFAVPGLDRVWALGDTASIIDPRTGEPMPATAQHAVREGPHAARNILAVLDGLDPRPFHYSQLGMLVSLGRFQGVGEVLGFQVSGFLAWVMWRGYYLMRLPSLDRKIRVMVDWTLDFILKRDIVEINVRRTRTRVGEQPGTGARGEPVSIGSRSDTHEELVL